MRRLQAAADTLKPPFCLSLAVYGQAERPTAQPDKWGHTPGLINALTKMLVVSHEAKRSGVHKARNGTPLALRA